ncbi:MAG: Anaerobic glycerol-3-phosphate dehydrogenase subunit A [Firmicutes bacterium]|uniref:Glycerol-3-phosphate dehydrogenase n=1 Tax=Candidatus Hakubella thermalkaliphila TaxID=2754717 RepID=A0A6V8P2G4_9ACTN|nr:FAD-dependent oxidoreductase [Candidatus Hakubella thermalkaliphila]MBT9176068.1 Anaerobic glycerol-3-phosphate dehydrogenase subunit A [Bacillota bacterium]GFP26729.1 glycerol-3-phosphate dehydrogenase [Candidatus Hakubella thermalkaliphila]GFP40978.1 glycerol-3-phosphate dehydrogenase [Candidatus Hakubella thermalkaliphila]
MRRTAVVIGGGSTGAATAHDLALRGLKVILVERGEIASGTTGRSHCLLHSGGRYAVTDQESAIECIQENMILRKILPGCLELNDGLFVALDERDLEFKPLFLEGCAACGIPAEEIPVKEVLRREPHLNPAVKAAIRVPDGVFEPFRLCLSYLATAKRNGAEVRTFTEVVEILRDNSAVTGVRVRDHRRETTEDIGADIVVNAAGPWCGRVAAMAGVEVPIQPTPGVMVAMDQRLVNMVINRLNKPSDGDIIVPQRQTSIIGTTSWVVKDPDLIEIPQDHVDLMLQKGQELVPDVRHARTRGIFAVARPLIAKGAALNGREVSRTFECFDHARDGVENFVTISGGKTTSARAMAEKVSDVICNKLGIDVPCRTREVVLASYREFF